MIVAAAGVCRKREGQGDVLGVEGEVSRVEGISCSTVVASSSAIQRLS